MSVNTESVRRYGAVTKRTSGGDAGESAAPAARYFTVRRLDQVKVLTDPLRQRILGAFMLEPRTTKQVAGRLGERPSKLYHHVDALARAGLLELKSTRQNRGTIEKYFQSVATHFTVDNSLFPSLPDRSSRVIEEFNAALDATREGLFHSLESASTDGSAGFQPLVERLVVRASGTQFERCREKLVEALADCRAICEPTDDDESREGFAMNLFLTKEKDD